jgi:hypothetical protein
MALTTTTLAAAKGTNDRVIKLTSATGATNQMIALVDGEFMRITDTSLTPTLGVVPGYTRSTATPHGILAPVTFGLPSDFVAGQELNPQIEKTSLSFGVDGAITGPFGAGTVPVNDVTIFLTKATAGAYTIAAPAVDQQNTITFISTTAAAHVLTMTGMPAATDVATFVANIGATLTIKAQGGLWDVIAGGTVSAVVA